MTYTMDTQDLGTLASQIVDGLYTGPDRSRPVRQDGQIIAYVSTELLAYVADSIRASLEDGQPMDTVLYALLLELESSATSGNFIEWTEPVVYATKKMITGIPHYDIRF